MTTSPGDSWRWFRATGPRWTQRHHTIPECCRSVAHSGMPWDTAPDAAAATVVAGARTPGARPWPDRRGSTAFMSLLLAAVGAIVAGLLELTIGSYVRIGDAQPHFVLVLGVIWTVAAGLDAGLAWAFAGGLLLDILAPRPLGSSAFALLVSLSVASAASRPLQRLRPLVPIALVPVLSLVNSMLLLVTLGAL